MNFLGLFSLKLVNFCKRSLKSSNNNENIKNNKNKFNNDFNQDFNKNKFYKDFNNDYNMFNEVINKNNLNHDKLFNNKNQDDYKDYPLNYLNKDDYKDNSLNYLNKDDYADNSFNNFNKEDYEDNQIKKDNKNELNFFKNIYSKIKKKFLLNNENNQEFIFKELKNQFDSNYKNNNQIIASNNLNDANLRKNSFYEKYSLNKILNQNIQEKVNLKIAIPIIVAVLAISIILAFIIMGLEIALAIVLIALFGFFFILYFPQMEKKKKYSEISRELPFALRHMVTELKSGKGLHETLNSIAIHDYGALSEEFSRVLEEIKYGENTETALLNMSKRVSSNGLSRTVQQIIGTLRTGGNLSNTLNIIAEDITHELQMKLKDYSQKLNAFAMIYTFLAILGPVIFLIMLMAASTVMGDVVPSNLVLILYIFFFPMIVIFLGLMIKRLEPSV